jgi:hypothetical protein
MSRRKIGETGGVAFSFYLKLGRRCHVMQGGKRTARVLITFGCRLASFALLCTLVLACCAQDVSRAQTFGELSDQPSDVEKAAYADALAYCSGDVLGPRLRVDKAVLCLEGWMSGQSDLALANELAHGGIFVVRSQGGGDVAATIALADLLLLKDATVVIKDYCLQACADYLFMATARTFVPKDALVA